jgi:hypothetical protein
MTVTPINMAEAIFEPFWDGSISGLSKWTIDDGAGHGLVVRQNWCWVTFEWARRPTDGVALRMRRDFDVSCEDYNDLILSVMAPVGSVVKIEVVTDQGTVTGQSKRFGTVKQEVPVNLGGARQIRRVAMEIHTRTEGIATGWFNWIGMRHRRMLKRYERQWRRFDARWESYLKPEEFVPSFKPAYGVLVTEDELETVRREHETITASGQASPFDAAAEFATNHPPEDFVSDYVNFWSDTRYNRVRDHGRTLLTSGANAAVAGMLRRDPKLLRLAARYALSLGHCEHWDDGFICRFGEGSFEHRCFVQSLCAFDVALILDLAGDFFTWQGRDFLMRRLAEEALGTITFNVWKHEYIHHCNQLAWFTPGRVMAMLVLERHWPRMKPYTEQAIAELRSSLEDVILPDGGYLEGPTYFRCVGRDGLLPLYLHARARGQDPATAIPDIVRRCANFGELVISTDASQDVIPACDAGNRHELVSQALLATALPESAWARMLAHRLPEGSLPTYAAQIPVQAMADLLLTLVIRGRMEQKALPPAPPLVALPNLGWAASTRQFKGQTVKLFLMGNQAGAGHTHEDKGSFVLEFAGETFAMDNGTTDYSSPYAGLAQKCERHNMLVPVVEGVRPHPECPLKQDVKPQCTGDETGFKATMDLTPGWQGFYRRWVRTWESPSPQELTIVDDYELESGSAVDFFWMTERAVKVKGRFITLTGKQGKMTIEAETGCEVRVDKLPFLRGTSADGKIVMLQRIGIRKAGPSGKLKTVVRLEG